ncbi:hypothetical protein OH779_22895 [Actinacidiphila glaucinigra]|uniref:coiled-coil domain-containing protein n=1 Tax=Actinacidiphila glaucinigra TaxID=235986 RepID=UPI0038653D3B
MPVPRCYSRPPPCRSRTPIRPTRAACTLRDVRAEVDALYRQAERATDTYNSAHERVLAQQKEIVALARVIDREQTRLRTLTTRAGALARAQYRGGGIGPRARPAAQRRPGRLPRRTHPRRPRRTGRRRHHRAAAHGHRGTRRLRPLRHRRLGAPHGRPEGGRRRRARGHHPAGPGEAPARRPGGPGAGPALERLEDEAAYRSQVAWLRTDAATRLRRDAAGAGRQGAAAVAFASAQIGKPYA